MDGARNNAQRNAATTAQSFQQVLALYPELHRLAEGFMRRERRDHTLQPTALVHEAFLRLRCGGDLGGGIPSDGESGEPAYDEFLCAASRAMRVILVEHARKRLARKRGGGRAREPLDESCPAPGGCPEDLLALDEALQRLQALDPPLARIVELRFFIGLDMPAIAEVLGVSTRTVERGWRAARTWLYHALNEGP